MNLKAVGGVRSVALAALLFGITAFAWLGVVRSAATMMPMPGMEPLSIAGMLGFTLQWGVMMTAMMLPSAAPMILLYNGSLHRRTESGERVIPSEAFALTYVTLWMLTGVPVYLAWVGVAQLAARSTGFAAAIPYGIAATLVASGVYQLTPAKHACLRQCQSPFDFLMRRWRSGYLASLQLAITHGAYCIGCCWALMVLLVVAGAMSLPWVLAIALVVFAEKILPGGARTARILGIALIAAGITMFALAMTAGFPRVGASKHAIKSPANDLWRRGAHDPVCQRSEKFSRDRAAEPAAAPGLHLQHAVRRARDYPRRYPRVSGFAEVLPHPIDHDRRGKHHIPFPHHHQSGNANHSQFAGGLVIELQNSIETQRSQAACGFAATSRKQRGSFTRIEKAPRCAATTGMQARP